MADDITPPRIEFNELKLPEVLDKTQEALAASDAPLFQRAACLVHVYRLDRDSATDERVRRKAGALLIRAVQKPRLREYLIKHVNYYEVEDGLEQPIAAPPMLSAHIQARQDKWQFRVLTGIIECPTILADGTLLATEGYHPGSGLMLDLGDLRFPPIPEAPTLAQAKTALNVVKDLIAEFPFVDSAARSVALAAILTALVRRSMPDAPVFGIDATKRATGKSLLCDVVTLIATGRRATVMNQPSSEEEAGKTWHAILMAGDPVVVVDNIAHPIGGATMCSVITQPYFQRRVLGRNGMGAVPTNIVVLCNGNNLTFGGDLPSRAIISRMDAGMEHPETRRFKIDLLAYIPEHRGKIVAAALTAMRGFVKAGRPMQFEPSRFKAFDALVRGCLIWCGEPDPMESQGNIEESDPERADLAAIIEAMRKCFDKTSAVVCPTAKDIVARAHQSDDGGQELASVLRPHMAKGIINKIAVSRLLSNYRGIIVDGRRIRREEDKHTKVTRFWIDRVTDKPSGKEAP
jgi:putative DNA primase/helicase